MRDDTGKDVPKFPLRLLKWFCKPAYHLDIEGDLLEIFEDRKNEHGLKTARRLLLLDVLLLFRLSLIKPIPQLNFLNHLTMYRHHFLISWRHLLKNKAYSLLNIGGLALGSTVALLIGLWILDETSFDRYHQNYERIAQVMQNQTFEGKIDTWYTQAKQLGPALDQDYKSYFDHISMSSFIFGNTLRRGENALIKKGIFMEEGAPEMLSLQMKSGNRDGLRDPYSVLLSASSAEAFFGQEDPVGQSLELNNKHELTIKGVFEDLPSNTTFSNVDFIGTWDLYIQGRPSWIHWGNSWFQTFVQIKENTDIDQVSAAIKNVKLDHVDEGMAKFKPELFLHPMSSWHLRSKFENGRSVGGRIEQVWLFGIIGAFVLFLACINFMNLSTAKSEQRAKEVGVRKALGSDRAHLIGQFFSETALIVGFALLTSLIFVQLLLPSFNLVTDKMILIPWESAYFWLGLAGFILLLVFLAGSYPALFLSSFQTTKVLKGVTIGSYRSALPRKVFIVIQFTVSVTLIIGTVIVMEQIRYSKNRPLGYNKQHLLHVPIKSDELAQRFDVFKDDLLRSGLIEDACRAESPVTSTFVTNSGFDWQGKDPGMADEFVTLGISFDFGKTVEWEIKEGRDFSMEHPSDSTGFVINEAAVAYLGFEDPIGQKIEWGENETYTIIGVVKNMLTQSPYALVRPMIFYVDREDIDQAILKLNPALSAQEAISGIEAAYKKHDPLNPFEFKFVDEAHARKFQGEERVAKLSGFFAILAILISCLGLLGMAAFITERRAKEISIRKVLGASVFNLWKLVSVEFFLLVLIACCIAVPIAYYFLSQWLQKFVYQVDLSAWIFVLVSLGALLITLLTVSFQAIKAALSNPSQTLKLE